MTKETILYCVIIFQNDGANNDEALLTWGHPEVTHLRDQKQLKLGFPLCGCKWSQHCSSHKALSQRYKPWTRMKGACLEYNSQHALDTVFSHHTRRNMTNCPVDLVSMDTVVAIAQIKYFLRFFLLDYRWDKFSTYEISNMGYDMAARVITPLTNIGIAIWALKWLLLWFVCVGTQVVRTVFFHLTSERS